MNEREKDYYKTLEIDKNANSDELKAAYRKLAFQYHPDRNKGNPAATERMKAINEAYATLSDPLKRQEYDSLRERYGTFAYDRFRQAHSTGDIFRGSDIDQVFEEFARSFGFRSSDEIFREFYGQGYQTFEFGRPGLKGFVYVRNGQNGEATQSPQNVEIPGAFSKLMKWALKASGIQLPERGKDWKDVIRITSEQAETGVETTYPYRKWGKPKDLAVKIPADTKNGQRIRLKGMGAEGKAGGESGDLYLEIRVKVPLSLKIKHLLGQA